MNIKRDGYRVLTAAFGIAEDCLSGGRTPKNNARTRKGNRKPMMKKK
jgi:hypothetical protein